MSERDLQPQAVAAFFLSPIAIVDIKFRKEYNAIGRELLLMQKRCLLKSKSKILVTFFKANVIHFSHKKASIDTPFCTFIRM